MTPELRQTSFMARGGHYYDILRTTIFTFAAVAAIEAFGPEGLSLPLTLLTIAATAYGVLAGGSTLDDLKGLAEDMDEATGQTAYGRTVAARNYSGLKSASNGLILLTGLALLIAVLT